MVLISATSAVFIKFPVTKTEKNTENNDSYNILEIYKIIQFVISGRQFDTFVSKLITFCFYKKFGFGGSMTVKKGLKMLIQNAINDS